VAAKAPKRAIALGGGGPAAGLHLGVLRRLTEKMHFDVWALSCIGAWVGIVYNQCDDGKEIVQSREFFHDHVFRDDVSYERFPINNVFAPDWSANVSALTAFLGNPATYRDLFLPPRNIAESFQQTLSFMTNPRDWTEGDFNQWTLNNVMAVNPLTRFLTSMMYLSNVTGLSRIYYPGSNFLDAINFDKLKTKRDASIFHNAWNLTKQKLELFYNRPVKGRHYGEISAASLCACSALPFIEEPVTIGKDIYCEGALIDTVNFKNLLEDHFDLDEIWISRIVDATQIHAPQNLDNALSNLCQLFAATVGEDDIKLFYYHVKDGISVNGGHKKWAGTIVEVHVDPYVNFEWSQRNLKQGEERGYLAADRAYKKYEKETGGEKNTTGHVRIINQREKTQANERRMRQ
jgi:predicted acylesterase/phospholipase RssA